jgi:hypothetical protein
MESSSTILSDRVNEVTHLAQRLLKEIIDNNQLPNTESVLDLLKELEAIDISVAVLEKTSIGKMLAKANKTLKRHRRTATQDVTQGLQEMIDSSNKLLDQWKIKADKEPKSRSKNEKESASRVGLPITIAEYRARLVSQNKDLYKDPPVLPPSKVDVESQKCRLPRRDKSSGTLTFVAGKDSSIKDSLKDFHPNRTPEGEKIQRVSTAVLPQMFHPQCSPKFDYYNFAEVIRAGSFGGTYFRPIMSAVTNIDYKAQDVLDDTLPKKWIDDIPTTWLTSAVYREHVNKFGVKCGGSLGMWESSGWIADSDPYGWFQWYCRFYLGRRCSDDARQISRWLKCAGPKGRFRSQLCNKILAASAKCDDKTVSPVIRQTLLHWGLEITPEVLEKHRQRVGK